MARFSKPMAICSPFRCARSRAKSDHPAFPVRPELVEGLFFRSAFKRKERPFDKLGANGDGYKSLRGASMSALEHVLRIAPAGPPRATVLIVPPLFEEANRTRRTLVLAMRALAAEGLSALLPDLPGQNESPIPLVEADLTRWRVALARSEEHTSELQSLMRTSYAV